MCFFVFGKSINVGVALFLKGSALFLPFHLPPLFYCATIVTLSHNKVNRQNEVFSKKTENAACLKKYSVSKRNREGLSAAKIQSAKPPFRHCFAMPPPTIWGPKKSPGTEIIFGLNILFTSD